MWKECYALETSCGICHSLEVFVSTVLGCPRLATQGTRHPPSSKQAVRRLAAVEDRGDSARDSSTGEGHSSQSRGAVRNHFGPLHGVSLQTPCFVPSNRVRTYPAKVIQTQISTTESDRRWLSFQSTSLPELCCQSSDTPPFCSRVFLRQNAVIRCSQRLRW